MLFPRRGILLGELETYAAHHCHGTDRTPLAVEHHECLEGHGPQKYLISVNLSAEAHFEGSLIVRAGELVPDILLIGCTRSYSSALSDRPERRVIHLISLFRPK